jgi:cytochrome P450
LEEAGMQTAAELDLAHLPLEEQAFADDPLPRFAAARRRHPWLAKGAYGYVVLEYQAIKDLLSMDDRLHTPNAGIAELMGAKGTPWGRFQEEQIMAQSGAAHRRVRDVLAPMFTPRAINQHRPIMREVVVRLLDEWAPKGAFDFAEFAAQFPIRVMCALIGAPEAALPSIQSSLEALGLAFCLDPDHVAVMNRAMATMEAYVSDLLAARRRGERLRSEPDLLDAVLAANDASELSDAEVSDLLIFLFVAGYDTSKNLLTTTMSILLDRPEDYARCAADLDYSSRTIEEVLRYQSPVTTARVAVEDIVYRDVLFPKGEMLFFPLSVSGRDPSAIPDPEAFRPERVHENRHMGFGRGVHICLGQYIARAQIEEGLHLIAQRLARPRRTGPVSWRPFSGAWGLRTLPIAFEPAAPAPTRAYSGTAPTSSAR